MLILLVLETTDILFAADSVPAVFGVTREPLVVYTSNIFAILGLRAMYFVLASALDLFYLLKYGLSFVLVFVGMKMALLDHLAGGRIPIGVSLAVIAGTVGISIVLSLVFPRTKLAGRGGLRTAVGSVFALLSLGSLLLAFGAGPQFLAGRMGAVRAEWLWTSGLCYAVSAWALFRGMPVSTSAAQQKPPVPTAGR
jgi:hypothetical protein